MNISISAFMRLFLVVLVLLSATHFSMSENSRSVDSSSDTKLPIVCTSIPPISCRAKCRENGYADGACVGSFCQCK